MLRFFASIIISLTLTGCELASLNAKLADWYAMRRIDKHFDLDQDQREFLEPRVHKHINWSKMVVLPEFRSNLDDLIRRIEGGLKAEDLVWGEHVIQDLRKRIGERLSPDAVEFLLTVNSDQHRHFQASLVRANKQWEERLDEKPEKYRRKAIERYEEKFVDWCGSINEDQRAALAQWYASFADLDEARRFFAGRVEAQEAFAVAIAPPSSRSKIAQTWEAWFNEPGALRTGVNKERYLARIALFKDNLLAIEKTLSSEQRKHLVAKIREQQKKIDGFIKTAD